MAEPGLLIGEELVEVRARAARTSRLLVLAASVLVGVVAVLSAWLSSVVVTSDQPWPSLVAGLFVVVVSAPGFRLAGVMGQRATDRSDRVADARQLRIDELARRRDFDSQVGDAFEMAETEADGLRVVERALAVTLPGRSAELLLADSSHAHLTRMASSSPEATEAGCQVASPHDCPAARRATVQRFDDSDAINACPKLSGRSGGRCSALCVPVAIMGRTVGVIHTVGAVGAEIDDGTIEQVQAIAHYAGARLGMLRIMAESQLQASTDGLTGLMNRRALENAFSGIRGRAQPMAVVMADLDKFKDLNDTYGHETGDRALRIFAETLKACLRAEDLACRHGGEEFALVFPRCSALDAAMIIERLRVQLGVAIREAGLPAFTASFGLVVASDTEDLDKILSRADSVLYASKRAGRDRLTMDGDASHDRPIGGSQVPVIEDDETASGIGAEVSPDACY
jgi:diguanylate cyclase (GGDEF)-like protein